MTPALIHRLEAGLIAHHEWPGRKWFYASPIWFYHRPRADERIIPNSRFYELVDPDLREICYLLHQHGLITTPSCQGHFYERPRFERIWDELSHEAEGIASDDGLEVKDCETDQAFLFSDRNFKLPWKDVDAFCAEAIPHQNTGFLGIVVPAEREDVIESLRAVVCREERSELRHDAVRSRSLGQELFLCLVHPADPTDRMELWRILTERVKSALQPIPVEAGPEVPARRSA